MRRIAFLLACVLITLATPRVHAQRDSAARPLPLAAVSVAPHNRPARLADVRPGRSVSTGLSVRIGRERYIVPLDPRVGTWRIDSVVPLAAAVRADTAYLLVDVSGRSRANDGSGYCGAGQEGDIVWMKLAHGRARELRSAPYESCFLNIETVGDVPYRRNADSLWSTVWILPPGEVRFHYDLRNPARGLLVFADTARADSLPRYPRLLAAANVEGEVVARVTRRPGPAGGDSITVLRSTHDLFSVNVRAALDRWSMRAWNDSARAPIVARFTFALRNAAECRALPPAPWEGLQGYRATMERRAPGELRGRVEACPAVTTAKTSTHY